MNNINCWFVKQITSNMENYWLALLSLLLFLYALSKVPTKLVMIEPPIEMFQKRIDKPVLNVGWLDRSMDKQLSKLVPPNGILKVVDRRSIEEFHDNCLKWELRVKKEQMINQMKLLIDWEMKMVLHRKLDPVLTNVHVLEHPVIVQRNAPNKIVSNDKEKVLGKLKKKYKITPYIKCIEEKHYKLVLNESDMLNVESSELNFGKSFIYDFHKYGKLFKKKMREHNKILGLHLPRSKHEVKNTDFNIEMLTHMKINSQEDNEKFYAIADKLINTSFF